MKKPTATVIAKNTKVSINKASAEMIATSLKGIGGSKAQAIVDWRNKNGAFTSIDQLLEIKGIGQKTLDLNRANISL